MTCLRFWSVTGPKRSGTFKRRRTSQPHPQHPVFPYFPRKMQIDRPNQVWCADITFVPVRTGFLYLVAIMDWASRKVLSWRLSNTMHADSCVDALREAIAKHGPPEIMNTDQGSQFTLRELVSAFKKNSNRRCPVPRGNSEAQCCDLWSSEQGAGQLSRVKR